ncbi:MAG: protein-L-isoaspartate(D-aspartate) O-methyltransferase [Patescibacteria group bacterium]|nr:protein-L-isoaspartate(D-aspartate) O-methyltransferase [Patescibacteria group bacterium]MCL5224437.1 protein-L-isoaspartate(D-aspartate) O-methyltransferase [Patescibacteria group bacterium]
MTRDELINELIGGGYLKTPALVDAFRSVDRRQFVAEGHKSEAYENSPLPIGFDQTISQPLTVAFMLEAIQVQPGDKVLDIGAGSGWQSTLLAYLVGETGKVIGVERIPELCKFAENNIANYPDLAKRVAIITGDAGLGYPAEAPYDRIIAAAAAEAVPVDWQNQLKIGGTLVAPIGQSIVVMHKVTQDKFETSTFMGFSFVPLIRE